jgi:hypothetical protein
VHTSLVDIAVWISMPRGTVDIESNYYNITRISINQGIKTYLPHLKHQSMR